jgi:hypothetical protein
MQGTLRASSAYAVWVEPSMLQCAVCVGGPTYLAARTCPAATCRVCGPVGRQGGVGVDLLGKAGRGVAGLGWVGMVGVFGTVQRDSLFWVACPLALL